MVIMSDNDRVRLAEINENIENNIRAWRYNELITLIDQLRG